MRNRNYFDASHELLAQKQIKLAIIIKNTTNRKKKVMNEYVFADANK